MDRRNMERALKQVERNDGAGGVDGMSCEELRPHLRVNWQTLRTTVINDAYVPSAVRKVEIDKPGGGKRMLGIPTVVDRMLQQGIAQWLEPQYDPGFSFNSYGFRPGRNAHQAVLQAQCYLNAGKRCVIELDLEKFFDRVNHDKLMGKLRKQITDKGTLRLIRSYLRSGIMEGGLTSPRTEGTPQGSPLSPILSNIVLDDLDKELERRGLSYVRYADDCSIYVSSERAAKRVLTSITLYIEERLSLKVNREKTKISRPYESTLLGYSFYWYKSKWEIRIAPKSEKRIREKCKLLTNRDKPISLARRIGQLEEVIRGWVQYFRLAKGKGLMRTLDNYVRMRMRMCKWKEWRRPKARRRNLTKLGMEVYRAIIHGGNNKGTCRVASCFILQTTLTNEYFLRRGYIGFEQHYYWLTTKQTSLF
jgi:RNA-directed DNA polymerase